MSIADVLYGVTMHEPGVSRKVSVKFSDLHEHGYVAAESAEGAAPAGSEGPPVAGPAVPLQAQVVLADAGARAAAAAEQAEAPAPAEAPPAAEPAETAEIATAVDREPAK
jgi:hypothetical protein